jgi:predicted porin
MAKFAAVMLLSLFAAAGARAASITNTDAAAVVVVVTEGGNRVQVILDAGASETFCPSGCFVTAPDGDRIGLDGGETIDIVKGSAVVK